MGPFDSYQMSYLKSLEAQSSSKNYGYYYYFY